MKRGIGKEESPVKDDPGALFEVLVHILEVSVVFGIGVMTYVIKKQEKIKKQRKLKRSNEAGTSS